MKSILLSAFLMLGVITTQAQTAQSTAEEPVFTVLDTEASGSKVAEFPGGVDGWRNYLEKNLKYPKKALKENIQGTVRVQFVVEKNGVISQAVALNNPGGGLADIAVDLIKKGPKWIPAEQGGQKVRYRHIQAIIFRLQ